MRKLLRSMGKSGLVFAGVVLLLALTLPPLAGWLGADLIGAGTLEAVQNISIVWNTVNLFVMGSLIPAVQTILHKCFKPEKTPADETIEALKAKVVELEGREHNVERLMGQAVIAHPSPTVQAILDRGPRMRESFAAAEEARAAQAQGPRSVH